MIERFGEVELIQLTDHDQLGVMNEAVLQRALDDADAEINGYIAVRMPVPAVTGLSFLSRLASDVARYRLYDDAVPDTVRLRYEDAVRALQAIAKGSMTLGEVEPATIGGQVQMQSSRRVFGGGY